MKTALFGLLMMVASSLQAASQDFPEFNFSIDIPSSWISLAVNVPAVKAAYRDPSGEKLFLLTAIPAPDNQRDYAVMDFLRGASDAEAKAGWTIFPQQTSMISGIPFLSQACSLRDATGVNYAVSAGNFSYGIKIQKNHGAASDDTELNSILQSFKLLNPVHVNENAERHVSAGTTVGRIVGRVMFFCTVPALIALCWFFLRRKKSTPTY